MSIEEEILTRHNKGQSIYMISKELKKSTFVVKSVLEKYNMKANYDYKEKGQLYVEDGEKLIEWAKSQSRPVSKKELAEFLGRKKLSPSYFIKYPELGKYVKTRGKQDLQDYNKKLYAWLKENNIPYKPDDRTKLGVSVSALLLEEYSGVAIQIAIKSKYMSKAIYDNNNVLRMERASEAGITIINLNEDCFENLDKIKDLLNDIKNK